MNVRSFGAPTGNPPLSHSLAYARSLLYESGSWRTGPDLDLTLDPHPFGIELVRIPGTKAVHRIGGLTKVGKEEQYMVRVVDWSDGWNEFLKVFKSF